MLSLGIKYSMHDLICDVNCCVYGAMLQCELILLPLASVRFCRL